MQNTSLLIVDDEADVLDTIREALKKDYKVYSAPNAKRALGILKDKPIQIILSDQFMPKMSGLQFLQRAQTIAPDTIKILFTGYTDKTVVIDAINSGVVWKYLQKPIDLDNLQEVIRQAEERITSSKEEVVRIPGKSEETNYYYLFENITDGIYKTSQNGKFITVNQAFVKMLGYKTKSEILKKNITRDLYFSELERERVLSLKRQNDSYLAVFRLKRKDGSELWVEDHGYIIKNAQDNPKYYEGVVRDVTKRVKAEEELKMQKKYYESLFESSSSAIVLLNNEMRVVQVNAMFTKIFGFEKDEAKSKMLSQLIIPEKAQKEFSGIFDRTLKCGHLSEEATVENKANTPIEVEFETSVVSIAEEKVGIYINYKIRENGEGSKSLDDDHYRILFDKILDPIIISDLDTHLILDFNKAAFQTYGYSAEILLKMKVQSLHPSDEILKARHYLENFETDQPRKFRHITRHGNLINVEIRSDKIRYQNRLAIISVIRDTTKRNKIDHELNAANLELSANRQQLSAAFQQLIASNNQLIQNEKTLKQNQELFRLITENATDLIAVLDIKGNFLYASPSYKWLLGYRPEFLQDTWSFDLIHKMDLTKALELFQKSLKCKKSYSIRYKLKRKNGHLISVDSLNNVILDNDGQPEKVVVVSHDVTERYKAEAALKKSKENSESANYAKSQFLANMSHEIRTPLNGIIGYTDLLLEERISTDQLGFVKVVQSSAYFLLDLINEILDFSKIESKAVVLESKPFVLSHILQEKIQMIVPGIAEKSVEVKLELNADLHDKFVGDPKRFGQIILNLLSNASKFTNQGHIKIITRKSRHFGKSPKTVFPIEIIVEDTGIGIPIEHQRNIFDSFSQVKNSNIKKYEGTGLGLAITKSLVELMGGKIELKSEIGTGTTFIIRLPLEKYEGEIKYEEANTEPDNFYRNTSPPAGLLEPKRVSSGKTSGKTDLKHILLAEDNYVNSALISEILSRFDYILTIVENGKEALSAIEKNDFDLILMDMQMPVMDGYNATRQIRENAKLKDVPIIALTAFAMKGDADKCLEAGCTDYINKPINNRIFIETVQGYLEEEKPSQSMDKLELEIQAEMEKLKKFYINDIKKRFKQLKKCLSAGDFENLSIIAHSLKGSGGSYGYNEITQIGSNLEMAAQSQHVEIIKEQIKILREFLKENG